MGVILATSRGPLDGPLDISVDAEGRWEMPKLTLAPPEGREVFLAALEADTDPAGDPRLVREVAKRLVTRRWPKPYRLARRTLIVRDTKPVAEGPRQRVTVGIELRAEHLEADATGRPDESTRTKQRFQLELRFIPTAPAAVDDGAAEASPQATGGDPEQDARDAPETAAQEAYEAAAFVAIDFGTANSTVTLFDPEVVPPQRMLAPQQRELLRQGLLAWGRGADLDPVLENDCLLELDRIGGMLPGGRDRAAFPERLAPPARVGEVLRAVERGLHGAPPHLRRHLSGRLAHTLERALLAPDLEERNLYPVLLDLVAEQPEVPSEARVTSLEPLTLTIGAQVRQDRQNLVVNEQDGAAALSEYLPALKRYLGDPRETRIEVSSAGKRGEVPVQKLIQSAYRSLIELTDGYRKTRPRQLSKGRLARAVVTYPTVAPPGVRRELAEIFTGAGGLGFHEVVTTYDEATAAAVFYLYREFGAQVGLGIEAYKGRCRKVIEHYVQNVLILDIGGGTTDIALLRLELSDRTPTHARPAPDAGGRFYVMTPRLLGSTGHLQLGGNLLSLKTFELLKVQIADAVFSLVAAGRAQSWGPLAERVQPILNELEGRFLDETGGYAARSLVETLKTPPDRETRQRVLDLANAVLPTRWSGESEPAAMQAFFLLWDEAEETKIALGSAEGPALRSLEVERIAVLLAVALGLPELVQATPPEGFSITTLRDDFEALARPVVSEAVKLAKALLVTRLPAGEKLEWLILSGKSSNLALVEREIRSTFARVDSFTWNPDRVTYGREYAKLATSIGACYAHHLWSFAYDPDQSVPLLRRGLSQVYFDVKNLFFFLPSAFSQLLANGQEALLLEAGTELHQLDDSKLGKARSEWSSLPLDLVIHRRDVKDGEGLKWCAASFGGLAGRIGLSVGAWRRHIRVQIEVDHTLAMQAYLVHTAPYHRFDPPADALDVVARTELALQESEGEFLLPWTLAVRAVGGAGRVELFRQGARLDTTLVDGEGHTRRGRVSRPLPAFPLHGPHLLHACSEEDSEQAEWRLVGKLTRPEEYGDFPQRYRLVLDQEGRVAVIRGELPYLLSENEQDLAEPTGRVFRCEFERQTVAAAVERDPFSGVH